MAKIEKGKIYRCIKECWLPIIDESGKEVGSEAIITDSLYEAVDDGKFDFGQKDGNKLLCYGAYERFFEEIEDCNEKVEHPSHYNQNGIECFDVIKAVIGEEGFEYFCYGNVIKYLFRAKYKGDELVDLEKAMFYLNEIINKND